MATPDETREQLIEALLHLVKQRGLSEISVRDVAAEAGVNHGLVHRYFGSKANLVKAATRRVSREVHAGYPGRQGLSAYTFRYLSDRPELVRVLAQACIEGDEQLIASVAPEHERLCAIVDAVRDAMAGLPVPVDPRVVNGYAIASILGWVLFKPLLEAGFELPEDADAQVEQALALLDQLVASRG